MAEESHDSHLIISDDEKAFYLILHDWKQVSTHYEWKGIQPIYISPFRTASIIFNITSAYRTQKKYETGEDCSGD